MHPDEQVRAYLWDIRDAAREIDGFVRGVSFEEFEKNKMLRYAVERQLHLIGGVAAQIPAGSRRKHPEINWIKLTERERHHMIELMKLGLLKYYENQIFNLCFHSKVGPP